MGAAKFPEEIVERYIECGSSGALIVSERQTTPLPPKPRVRYCPLCFEGYLEEKALDDHIARSHGKQHVYLKVNGRIVRDVCWLKQPLKECLLVLLQISSLDVEIHVNGEEKRQTIRETACLMEQFRGSRAKGVIRIRTEGGPFSRRFTIYSGRQPKFHATLLDATLIGMMGRLKLNRRENLVTTRDKCLKGGLNDLESRYLDGVVEYCHGWQLEMENAGSLARGRLEMAMDLLMPFHTELALDLRCALALRMNCFGGEWGCEADSPFRVAENFFCGSPGEGEELHVRIRETSIPLDPNSGLILDALRAYYANDEAGVLTALKTLRTAQRVRDRNDEDKLNLIEARTRAKTGDRHGAVHLFELFRGHPVYDEEARSQLATLA